MEAWSTILFQFASRTSSVISGCVLKLILETQSKKMRSRGAWGQQNDFDSNGIKGKSISVAWPPRPLVRVLFSMSSCITTR